ELPLLKTKKSFWIAYESRVWKTVKELKKFLIKVIDKPSNVIIRNKRKAFVDELIEHLLQFSSEIIYGSPKGWSDNSELSFEEKLWLDPFNEDEEFKKSRETIDWK